MNFEEYLVADFLNGGHAITSIREADEHPERLIPVDIDKLSEFIESKGKLY